MKPPAETPRCGLCGATEKLTRTACCDRWVCDDEDRYVLFSYARNSCHRNHSRYTLCGFHFNEEHAGRWQDCLRCREGFEPELYAYFGTNAYNFERLANPPPFEPTHCARCRRVIRLSVDGYAMTSEGYQCERCMREGVPTAPTRPAAPKKKPAAPRVRRAKAATPKALHRFALNPYSDARFSSCSLCDKPTRLRKFVLAVQIEPSTLVALGFTCRYCTKHDLIIAHQDVLEAELAAHLTERQPEVVGHPYEVLGTFERKVWREGL